MSSVTPGELGVPQLAHGVRSACNEVAVAREQFLHEENVEQSSVRNIILASWRRSRTWHVAADHIEPLFVKNPNLDTPVARCARPILQRLREQLNDLPVSVILTDESGLVLDRRTDDTGFTKYLDRVQLAPGFNYAEQFVGTNGIGTALEGLQSTTVFGHEHYVEHLDTLGCAGVPIRHPVSGQVIGLLGLTCWSHDAGPLLVALAKSTAREIQQELIKQVGERELSLVTEYLRACRRERGIVLAVNNDLVMSNQAARQSLDPRDQSALLPDAAELLAARRDFTRTVDLPSGAQARISCTPVTSAAGPAGGVIRAQLVNEVEHPPVPVPPPRLRLSGIVGSGALWLHACQGVLTHHRAREWLTIDGESGVGKLAIAAAAHAQNSPGGSYTVVDFADDTSAATASPRLREALRAQAGTIVLRHLHQAPPGRQAAVASELSAVRNAEGTDCPCVVATIADGTEHAVSADLLEQFPFSVTVPPLRHHVDDIRDLVPFLLRKLSHGRVTCTSAALQLLLRATWPGNVTQLNQVLRKAVQRRRAGSIEPADLPPDCRTVTKRVLTPLESLERDAIVQSLLDADGNKTQAARALGMSRATIYRKIRHYGIDVPS